MCFPSSILQNLAVSPPATSKPARDRQQTAINKGITNLGPLTHLPEYHQQTVAATPETPAPASRHTLHPCLNFATQKQAKDNDED